MTEREALKLVYENSTEHDWPEDIWNAIKEALAQPEQEQSGFFSREAMKAHSDLHVAQPEQEPVAKAVVSKRKTYEHHITDIDLRLTEAGKRLSSGEHCLYTTPPTQCKHCLQHSKDEL